MKNDNYKNLIERKDNNQNDRIRKNKKIIVKILLISIVCLVLTLAFMMLLIKTSHFINVKTGVEKNIDKNDIHSSIQEWRSININIEEIFYIRDKGRKEINRIKIVEMIIIIVMTISFYVWLFNKMISGITVRISEICNYLDNMTSGEYDSKLDENGDDELARMSADLNVISTKFNEILEEERKSEATKNELITSIAHDLRTPITSIIGYLDIIIRKELDENTKNKYIRISYDKSVRLERLIEDLFTYTKFSLGQYPINPTTINLGKLMEQLIEEFYPSFMDEDLECEFVCEKTVMIEADGDLVARLFANLMSNSIKYGKDGKNINVNVYENEGNAVVDVINFGQTIPANELSRIFEKFYRVESSRSTSTGGTGLGLAIVKEIVDLHSGTIDVESGINGTIFSVKLPLKQDKQRR